VVHAGRTSARPLRLPAAKLERNSAGAPTRSQGPLGRLLCAESTATTIDELQPWPGELVVDKRL
jgi:hypothetical protein